MTTITLTNGANDQPEPINWLWDGWLAEGKLELVAGMKGAGKSTMIYSLFATITIGGKWPDGTQAPIGDVLVWSNEDDYFDTILPRFMAAGGDKSRLYRIGTASGIRFDPRRHMDDLITAVKQLPDLKAILIDPIVAVTTRDSNKNAETRHDLQSLVDLAQERRATVIGITHLTKGTAGRDPIERVTGSLAFGAVPRVVLFVVKNEEDDKAPRRLVRAASNISASGGGFEFTVSTDPVPGMALKLQTQRVLWGAELKGSGRTLVEELDPTTRKDAVKKNTALDAAKAFILLALAAGPVPTKDIEAAACANGITLGTLRRAYSEMPEIAAEPISGSRAWQWRKVNGMGQRSAGVGVGAGAPTTTQLSG